MGRVGGKPRTAGADPQRAEQFAGVLAESIAVVEGMGIPYLVAGSLASTTWGRPGPLGDIDLLVGPVDAEPLLEALAKGGFTTEQTYPQWLFKAIKRGLTVDLIFEMAGPLYLEPQMIDRASIVEVLGTKMRLMGPEDFVISQALALKEDTAVYWFNAMGVIGRSELDWDYMIEMSTRGPRKILALLLMAQSEDLPVPDTVIRKVFANTFPSS